MRAKCEALGYGPHRGLCGVMVPIGVCVGCGPYRGVSDAVHRVIVPIGVCRAVVPIGVCKLWGMGLWS